MSEAQIEGESLHDTLTSAFAAVDNSVEPVIKSVVEEPVEQVAEKVSESSENSSVPEAPEAKADRIRDEKGKFAKVETQPTEASTQPVVADSPARPKTWKKEYLPIWDKIAKGEAPTPDEAKKLAAYQTQRENEYQAGITQHKTAADQARHLTDALTPYIPVMQERGLSAPAFIKTLGDTMAFLTKGSPDQKMRALAQLANDVGIPLHAIAQTQAGQQVDPIVPQLLQHIQTLESKVNNVANWREQQETQAAHAIVSKFLDTEQYPYFEQVRGTMGNLLLQGYATTPEAAYAKAVRMNDEVWEAEQERQAQLQASRQVSNIGAVVAKAKSSAVSPRSSAPSGLAGNGSGSGEIADLLRKGFSQASGRV